jgi:ferredoxin-type protein NapH
MLSQHVVFWGKFYPFSQDSIQWIPIGFYGGVLGIAFASVLLGRVFCGWSCPHNTLTEWTRSLRACVGREAQPLWMKRWQQRDPQMHTIFRWCSPLIALGLTVAFSTSLVGFVVPPMWIVQQYGQGHPHIALVFGQGLFTLIGLFLLYCGHDFCRTCCPYGMGQSISAYIGDRWRPMEITYTGQDQSTSCKTCTACQQICPVDIDPRDANNLKVGQFAGCFNCGDCIDACTTVHEYRQQPSLLGFAVPRLLAQGSVAPKADDRLMSKRQ